MEPMEVWLDLPLSDHRGQLAMQVLPRQTALTTKLTNFFSKELMD
jgi:hypothetical protein